ncbi:MAG: integrase, partial [bacterium]|nr:integrase [bacterium]
ELSHSMVSKLPGRVGIDGTLHGMRSSFRDWCGETGVAREVAEACLAHRIGTAAEQAYARSDLLTRRRAVMEAWGQYVSRS